MRKPGNLSSGGDPRQWIYLMNFGGKENNVRVT